MNEPENLKAQAAADQENARIRDQREASPDGMTPAERAVAASSLQHLTIAQRAQQIGRTAGQELADELRRTTGDAWSFESARAPAGILKRADGLELRYSPSTSTTSRGRLSYSPPDCPGEPFNLWTRSALPEERDELERRTSCTFDATRPAAAIVAHWARRCAEATERAHRLALYRVNQAIQAQADQAATLQALRDAGYTTAGPARPGETCTAYPPANDRAPRLFVENDGRVLLGTHGRAWTRAEALAVVHALRAVNQEGNR